MSVAGVVLAAGFSRRLGRPKQTVVLGEAHGRGSGGETLLARTVRRAADAGLSPILAVIHDDPALRAALTGLRCEAVVNHAAAEGMASSIRAGLAALPGGLEPEGVVLMACDQPALTAAHLRALCRVPGRITGSAYGGRVGVPAYFPRSCFAALGALAGDAGARTLLAGAASVADEALALDVDTEADLARVQSHLGGM